MAHSADQDSPLDVAPTRLRIGAAAASLGVSVDTLRRWEKEGRIHFERVGNQRVISSDEVERLLHERPARARTSSARNRLGHGGYSSRSTITVVALTTAVA